MGMLKQKFIKKIKVEGYEGVNSFGIKEWQNNLKRIWNMD